MKKLHGQVAKSTACPWWWARMTQWRKSWVRMTQWRNGAHESRHYARECRYRNDQKGAVVNAIDEEIITTLSDVCVVQGKVQGWWYDTCATVHVTYDKSLFKTFEDAKGDQEVQMGNEGRSKVLGKGTIEVAFTSGKRVTLINVLYVPDMNKNLVSGDLLGKPGIKAVFESGYASNSKAYRLLDLESNVIIESREVEFFENLLSDSNSQVPTSVGESPEETPSKNDGRSVAQLEYASAIGSLMYAAQCTRADISFAVSKLSRFTSNPSVEHWKAIGRVLGYLKNTKELSLQYSKFPAIIEGYSDASWISSVGDNLSTTGWVFTLGGGAVSWGSKKQTCISHSAMEAEFIALAATGIELEWLRDLMMDIPFTANNVSTVSIHCDSQATLARAYSGVYNGKSRHISIRHEYVRQLIQNGIISISFVRSSGNLADPFTKPLTRDLVRITSRGMGLKLLK
eukprot:XP_010661281.1 PREDICTED: uncharacterized protein LOC104881771 [Vitis vinifera]